MSNISLALSGGGAAGIAHIPVLEAIDSCNLKPQAIAGTSIGALLGVCYAAGMSAADIRAHVIPLISDLPGLGRRLIVGGAWWDIGLRRVLDPAHVVSVILPEAVPETFEELPINFTCVATDFYGQKARYFSTGPLRPALAASMAIPGIFKPQIIDDTVYIDGGMTDNLPVSALSQDHKIIAVDVISPLSVPRDGPKLPRPVTAASGAFRILVRALTDQHLARFPPSVLLKPNIGHFGPHEFHRMTAVLQAAEPAHGSSLADLKGMMPV